MMGASKPMSFRMAETEEGRQTLKATAAKRILRRERRRGLAIGRGGGGRAGTKRKESASLVYGWARGR